MKKGTKYVMSLLLVGLVFAQGFPIADAQVNPDEEGCVIKEFRENAYAPFRIIMVGDPSIRNSIEDIHNDEASRFQLDKSEFEGEESPSVVNFFTNSVDDWKWTVRQEYKVEAVEPRPVEIAYQSNNIEFQRETIYRTGFDFCIVYIVNVREAPHIFTEDEILETADKIQEENFLVVGSQIESLVNEVISTKNFTIGQSLLGTLFLIMLIVTNFMQNRGAKALKRGLNEERQFIAQERSSLYINYNQLIMDVAKWADDTSKKFSNFFSQTEVSVNTILLDIDKIKETIPGLKIEYSPDFIGPLTPDDEIVDEDGYSVEKRIYSTELGDVDAIPNDYISISADSVTKEKLETLIGEMNNEEGGFIQRDKNPEPEEEDDKDYVDTILDTTKDTLLDSTKKIKETIFKPKDEIPMEDRDELYYLQYYREKLSGYNELIEEHILQNTEYVKQNKPTDIYYRLKALSVLLKDEKFDPKKEMYD